MLGGCIGALALSNRLWAAQADSFPSKPIRFVVPFAPGGSTDILARIVGRHMFPGSGQAVVVENVPGAGGNIGATQVARSPADGYTLEIGSMSTHAMDDSLYRKLSFDPVGDFQTVAMLAYAINAIAVSSKLPVKNLDELLAYIRAHPGKLNYASGGIGSHNHLTMALLAKVANLDIVHVPYKGGGPAVTALVRGECDMFAGGASLLLSYVKSGQVRLIAVTEPRRYAGLPDIPSVSELIKGFKVTNWYGVFGPKGMSTERTQLLNKEINHITALPEVAERFKTLAMVRDPLTPTELHAMLEADHKLWATTIKSLSISPE